MIETENKVYARRCESHVEALRRAVPGCIEKVEWQCEDQLTITVKQDKLPEAVHYLYYERYGWIPVIIGNDERSLCGRYAVYYVISREGEGPGWVTVRTEVDPAKMTFPSVTPFVPACVWGERELRDMFGLIPEGLPDRRRLVLPDDWPSGLYPLRKDSMDYRFRPAPASDMENYEFLADTKGKETTLVPMGPLHITSDEPGHFRLFVEGETIVDADYRLFYVHRGMEKVAETLGNSMKRLNEPNLVTIFVGIVLGIIVGSLPISFPGIPQPVKLGLAGGPLIVAILISRFGYRYKLVTYTTQSSNLLLRELGITLFLACVGLSAGEGFVDTIVNKGGVAWIGYGFIITLLPLLIIGCVGRYFYKLNYFTLMGLIAGSTTDPPALAYSNMAAGNDAPAVGYATVYPLTMFLRVLTAQLMILFFYT